MLEILKKAYDKPRALTQNRAGSFIDWQRIPNYIWELYPLKENYYHEFNPYFVHTAAKPGILKFFPLFTVRDGAYAFSDFLVKNLAAITKEKTSFLIPGAYAPLVPERVRSQFGAYTLSQNRVPDVRKARSVVIFTLLNEGYFGSLELIREKLKVLKDLPPTIPVEVCISQRRNPLLKENPENNLIIHFPDLVREMLPGRELKWTRLQDLMEKTNLRDVYLLDLLEGFEYTCDSYLHFRFLSLGGMVNIVPHEKPRNSLFDIDVSLFHQFHALELPKSPSGFNEVLFLAKTLGSDAYYDPKFQHLVRKLIAEGSGAPSKG